MSCHFMSCHRASEVPMPSRASIRSIRQQQFLGREAPSHRIASDRIGADWIGSDRSRGRVLRPRFAPAAQQSTAQQPPSRAEPNLPRAAHWRQEILMRHCDTATLRDCTYALITRRSLAGRNTLHCTGRVRSEYLQYCGLCVLYSRAEQSRSGSAPGVASRGVAWRRQHSVRVLASRARGGAAGRCAPCGRCGRTLGSYSTVQYTWVCALFGCLKYQYSTLCSSILDA